MLWYDLIKKKVTPNNNKNRYIIFIAIHSYPLLNLNLKMSYFY